MIAVILFNLLTSSSSFLPRNHHGGGWNQQRKTVQIDSKTKNSWIHLKRIFLRLRDFNYEEKKQIKN